MRVLVVVTAVTVLGLSAAAGRSADDGFPPLLTGVPLSESTRLRLVASSNPPLVVDVDTGRVMRIRGLDVRGNPVLSVLGVGDATVVWLWRRTGSRSITNAEISIVPKGSDRATRIATAWQVAPSADRKGVWLKTHLGRSRCSVREITLDGSPRTRPLPVPCSSHLVDAGGRALLVRGRAIIEPASQWVLARAPLVLAFAGDVLVTATGRQGSIVLTDLDTGRSRKLDYPSRIAGQGGFDEAVVDQAGKLVALSFADPAFELTGTQVTDVWLLDTATGSLRQLPDMPAAVSLKRTSMSWTADGRLVILAEVGGRALVAVWRPGQERLAVRPLRLPERTGGSDAFVAR